MIKAAAIDEPILKLAERARRSADDRPWTASRGV